ncbi:MAG: hypothetical protein Q8Q73_08375 [Stagnimonas sp.]|nr:hypothetical protein [Stagnimonas sp.]
MNFMNTSPGLPVRRLGFSIARLLGLGSLALIVTACASVVYEGKYPWKEGWREAKVMQVGTSTEIGKPQYSDCRGKLPPEQVASGQFASVLYSNMSRRHRRVLPLQPGDAFRPGEEVYVNVTSCTAPMVRQTPGAR